VRDVARDMVPDVESDVAPDVEPDAALDADDLVSPAFWFPSSLLARCTGV